MFLPSIGILFNYFTLRDQINEIVFHKFKVLTTTY